MKKIEYIIKASIFVIALIILSPYWIPYLIYFYFTYIEVSMANMTMTEYRAAKIWIKENVDKPRFDNDEEPMIVYLKKEDAVAFKLRFGL